MNTAQTLLLADSWGMHDDGDIGMGWWIIGVPFMLLMMGAMMWMMIRGMAGGSSTDSSAAGDDSSTDESPLQILNRRFAEGDLSIEEYHARREALGDGNAERTTNEESEQPTAARAGGGS